MIGKKPPFRGPQATLPLRGYNQPLGFLPTVKAQAEQLFRDVEGIRARLMTRLGPGEPAAAVGERVFLPEGSAFAYDVLQTGLGTVNVQYVLRDAQTYSIPVIFPPPGAFRARYLNVSITQRVASFVDNTSPAQGVVVQTPTVPHGVSLQISNMSQIQTNKFSYPDTGVLGNIFMGVSSRINFCWNVIDNKSGNRLSDQWLPDTLLLQQAAQTQPYLDNRSLRMNYSASGGCFEFDLDWLFERDADIAFQFRPVTPVLQPTVATGAVWDLGHGTFDDREFGGAVRNNALTVKVELHGTRHYTKQDAMRVGALSRDD